jgi:hypothetical protein
LGHDEGHLLDSTMSTGRDGHRADEAGFGSRRPRRTGILGGWGSDRRATIQSGSGRAGGCPGYLIRPRPLRRPSVVVMHAAEHRHNRDRPAVRGQFV